MSFRGRQLNGFVLSRNPTGENFLRLSIFDRTLGLSVALFRQVGKRAKTFPLPDLFDEIECTLGEIRKQGSMPFISEYRMIHSYREIAQKPTVFLAASEIGKFYLRNGTHLLDPGPQFQLLRRALESFSRAIIPNVVLFKLYYCFSRDEGLPVRQSWLSGLSKELYQDAQACLSQPVNQIHTDPSQIGLLLESLKVWMNEETELRID